jgi:hypothetical protein
LAGWHQVSVADRRYGLYRPPQASADVLPVRKVDQDARDDRYRDRDARDDASARRTVSGLRNKTVDRRGWGEGEPGLA